MWSAMPCILQIGRRLGADFALALSGQGIRRSTNRRDIPLETSHWTISPSFSGGKAMHFLRLVIAVALAGPLMSCGQGPQGPMGNVGPPGPPGPKGDPGPEGRCVGRIQGGVVECMRNLERRT